MAKQAKPAMETLPNGAVMYRVESESKPAKAKQAKPVPATKTSKPAKAKGEAKAKPAQAKSLPLIKAGEKIHFFHRAPGGNLLRAYFSAIILAQLGGWVAGKPFTLWAGNFGTHRASGKLVHKYGNVWELSAAGVNYFTDPQQVADAALLDDMAQAIRDGKGRGTLANQQMYAREV